MCKHVAIRQHFLRLPGGPGLWARADDTEINFALGFVSHVHTIRQVQCKPPWWAWVQEARGVRVKTCAGGFPFLTRLEQQGLFTFLTETIEKWTKSLQPWTLVSEGQWSLERWAMRVFSILTPNIRCFFFFPPNTTFRVLYIPPRCPRTQFSSDTVDLELGVRSHQWGRDLVLWDCTYFLCQLQVLGHPFFWLTDCKSRVPMTPSSGSIPW